MTHPTTDADARETGRTDVDAAFNRYGGSPFALGDTSALTSAVLAVADQIEKLRRVIENGRTRTNCDRINGHDPDINGPADRSDGANPSGAHS